MRKKQIVKKSLEYLPPSDEEIYQLAQSICSSLAERADTTCSTSELVTGLAGFMRLAVRIQAKHLNQTQSVDKALKSEYQLKNGR